MAVLRRGTKPSRNRWQAPGCVTDPPPTVLLRKRRRLVPFVAVPDFAHAFGLRSRFTADSGFLATARFRD